MMLRAQHYMDATCVQQALLQERNRQASANKEKNRLHLLHTQDWPGAAQLFMPPALAAFWVDAAEWMAVWIFCVKAVCVHNNTHSLSAQRTPTVDVMECTKGGKGGFKWALIIPRMAGSKSYFFVQKKKIITLGRVSEGEESQLGIRIR